MEEWGWSGVGRRYSFNRKAGGRHHKKVLKQENLASAESGTDLSLGETRTQKAQNFL